MPHSASSARRPAVPLLLSVAAFVVVVAGMRAALPVLFPFVLSIFIAVVAAPPVFWLQRRGLPKWLAMLSVLAALAAVGMFLSVPLTLTAKIALDSHNDTRWVAVLLGPENALQVDSQPTQAGDIEAVRDGADEEFKQEEHG